MPSWPGGFLSNQVKPTPRRFVPGKLDPTEPGGFGRASVSPFDMLEPTQGRIAERARISMT